MLGVTPSDGVLRRLDLYSVWNCATKILYVLASTVGRLA